MNTPNCIIEISIFVLLFCLNKTYLLKSRNYAKIKNLK